MPAEVPYPEPELSRPLLLGLVSLFALAQIFFEGMRFGLDAPGHALALPLLEFLKRPGALAGDPLQIIAPLHASPFWSLVAGIGQASGVNFPVFLVIHIAARWAATLAVFRLGERAFGHPMAGLLAAALWVGYGDTWPGGVTLHHDYLTHSDVALALLLWALVLWSEARGTWGLLCGLAACANAPLALVTFVALWTVTWWTPPVAPDETDASGRKITGRLALLQSRWRRAWLRRAVRGAGRRADLSWRAVVWLLLGALPLLFQLAPQLRAGFAASDVSGSGGAALALRIGSFLARLHGPLAPLEFGQPPGALWRLLALLAVGLWCWSRARRQSDTTRALAAAMLLLGVWVLVIAWLLAARPTGGLAGLHPLRAAPLAVSLGLVGVAHVLERAVARQGSGGLLAALLLVFGFITVPGPPPLWLIFGLLFIGAANRGDRSDATKDDGDIAPPARDATEWLRRHWQWAAMAALLALGVAGAASPALALRLTGSPVSWPTVGWMTASLLAWIAARPRPLPRSTSPKVFAPYKPGGGPAGSALERNTQAALARLRASRAGAASQNITRLRRLDVGRYALVAFVLAFGWRAREATGWRLRAGSGLLSAPQPTAWQAAQFWAKNNAPRRALFLATQPGFRVFSRRAAFIDPADGAYAALSSRFARQWQWRSALAAPLWRQSAHTVHSDDAQISNDQAGDDQADNDQADNSSGDAFTPRDLQALQAHGVTHLVERTDRPWPRSRTWPRLLRPIYSNREWTIYRVGRRQEAGGRSQ